MEDVKLEVMRARGAGGQVKFIIELSVLFRWNSASIACEQNRVSSSLDPHPNRNYCLNAGRKKSAPSEHSSTHFVRSHCEVEPETGFPSAQFTPHGFKTHSRDGRTPLNQAKSCQKRG